MEMICFQAIAQGLYIGEIKILVVVVLFGVKVSRMKIGILLDKGPECKHQVSHMVLMISIVQDHWILGQMGSSWIMDGLWICLI